MKTFVVLMLICSSVLADKSATCYSVPIGASGTIARGCTSITILLQGSSGSIGNATFVSLSGSIVFKSIWNGQKLSALSYSKTGGGAEFVICEVR